MLLPLPASKKCPSLTHRPQQPVDTLSKERPQNNIFNLYIIPSVLLQFAIHIATLIYISRLVSSISPKPVDFTFDPDAETEFEPSLLNSAIYLLQLIQQISTFAINYQGRPFREGLSENRGMWWGILLVSGVAFAGATEFIPEMNEKLRLVPFSPDFKVKLTVTMIVDFVGCWVVEKGLKLAFSDYKPRDITLRRGDQVQAEEARRVREAEEKDAAASA